MKNVLLLFVVMSLFVSACGVVIPAQPVAAEGTVWVAQAHTTVYWVNQALQGANFTQILTNGQGGYFIIWNPSSLNGVGFTLIKEQGSPTTTAVLDWMKATGGKGNMVNFRDMSGIVNYMKDNGWKTVAAAEVPATLKASWSTLWQLAVTGALQLGSSLISILVVPVSIFPSELLDPGKDAVIMG